MQSDIDRIAELEATNRALAQRIQSLEQQLAEGQSQRPSRGRILEACSTLVSLAGGVRRAADACGEHPSNFVNIHKGRRYITWQKLLKIERAIAHLQSTASKPDNS